MNPHSPYAAGMDEDVMEDEGESLSPVVEIPSGDCEDLGAEAAHDMDPSPAIDPCNFNFQISIPEFHVYKPPNAAESPTRLCIKAIVTENFKSFYGKKILGPFDQKFTAIVGPNGCGKSNTLDSLLFVFGFSSRRLRTKKIQDLIHSSSEHADCGRAKVTVHFVMIKRPLNDISAPPVDNPHDEKAMEFSISRLVRKDGVSSYYVNEVLSSRGGVVQKLKDYGVDLDHNRFLILQGEVEQISMMKPTAKSEHEEGMLEYLEDIIGSNRLKEPIIKFDELVEQLSGEMETSESTSHRLRTDMNGMRPEKLKAESYLQKEGESLRLEHLLTQVRMYSVQNWVQGATEEITVMKSALKEKQRAVQDCKNQEKCCVEGQNAISTQLKRLQTADDTATAEHQEYEGKKAKVEQDLKNRKKVLKQSKNQAGILRQEIEELKKSETDVQSRCELCEKQKELEEKITEDSASFRTAQEKVAAKTSEHQAVKSKYEKKLAAAEMELFQATVAADAKKTELNAVLSHRTTAGDRVKRLSERLDLSKNLLRSLKEQQEKDNASLNDVQLRLSDAEQNAAVIARKREPLEVSLRTIREKITHLRYSEQNQKQAKSRDRAINELLRCRSTGEIQGILGRLGDLGAVEKKYEVAVSAIGANKLDFVVVESVESSKACMEQLKRTGVGRASIMVLDQIRSRTNHNQMNSARFYGEGCPRLFDLISMEDSTVRPAFYYVLRDCLVAGDLDQAIRVSDEGHTRHRVATVSGQLVDPNGAMTGGGNVRDIEIRIGQTIVAHSSPVTPVDGSELLALERESQRLSEEIRVVNQEATELSVHIPELRRQQRELTARLKAALKDIRIHENHVSSLPLDLQKAGADFRTCQVDDEAEAHLNEEIKQLLENVQRITLRRDEINAKMEEVDGQIWEVRGEQVRESEKRLKKHERQLKETKDEINKLTTSIRSGELAVTTKTSQLQKKETQVAQAATKIAELEKEVKDFEEAVASSTETVRVSRAELQDAQKSFDHMKQKIDEIMQESDKVQRQVEKLLEELKVSENETKRAADKLRVYRCRLGEITEAWKSRPFAIPVDFRMLGDEELHKEDTSEIKRKMTDLKRMLDGMKVNLTILEDFATAKQKSDDHSATHRELKQKVTAANAIRKQLIERRRNEFMESFDLIRKKLKQTYYSLTLGGDAELEIVDRVKLFSEGIEFNVRPPNKSWKSISNLSGGEKTLSSLSLIFALHHYKPTPFYIMDEIDAALDYRNVAIAGHYIRNRAFDAQFIVVSLRPDMYQQAALHLGIFKIHNATQISVLSQEAYKNFTSKNLEKTLRSGNKNRKHGKDGKADRDVSRYYSKIIASIFSSVRTDMDKDRGHRKRSLAATDFDRDGNGIASL